MIPVALILCGYLAAIYLEGRRRMADFQRAEAEIPESANIIEQILREGDPVRSYWSGIAPLARFFSWGIAALKHKPARAPKVIRPPGTVLLKVVVWLYRPRTVARIFEPIVSDMQLEQISALGEGRRWKARWVVIRGYWDFARAVGAQGIVSGARRIFEFWKISGGS